MYEDIIDSRDIIDDPEEYADFIAEVGEDEIQGYADNGEAFIADHYFADYAEQLAEDIGAIDPSAATWPLYHIDWEAAADDLKQDYTSYEVNGDTYWIRSY